MCILFLRASIFFYGFQFEVSNTILIQRFTAQPFSIRHVGKYIYLHSCRESDEKLLLLFEVYIQYVKKGTITPPNKCCVSIFYLQSLNSRMLKITCLEGTMHSASSFPNLARIHLDIKVVSAIDFNQSICLAC